MPRADQVTELLYHLVERRYSCMGLQQSLHKRSLLLVELIGTSHEQPPQRL